MDKNLTIFKQRELANAVISMTLNQCRLLELAVATQDVEICPKGRKYFIYNLKEVCKFYNISYDGRAYKQFKDATDNLFLRHFSYVLNEKETEKYQIVSSAKFHTDGIIKICFGDEFYDLLQAKKGNKYLKYKLSQVSTLTTVYGFRMYELLLSSLQVLVYKFDDRTRELDKIIYIDEIKKFLSLETKYARFANFKKEVLEKAMLQINEKTDIHYSYSIIKKGRTPEKIRFRVKYKDITIKASEQAVKPVTTDGFDGFDDIPRSEILSDLEQQLILIDFSKSKAEKLILQYGESLIYEVLETLKGAKNIKSKAGFLISQLQKSKLKNDTKKILDDINEQKQKQHNDELTSAIARYKRWYKDNKKSGGIGYHDFLNLIRYQRENHILDFSENILLDLFEFAESYLPR